MVILAVALPRNPNHPHARGTAQCDDIYFQAVEVCVCVCVCVCFCVCVCVFFFFVCVCVCKKGGSCSMFRVTHC